MRIVMITKFVPWPANSGEKRRALAIARTLQALGDVSVVGYAGEFEDANGLTASGFDVHPIRLQRSLGTVARGLLATGSMTASRFWSKRFADAVGEVGAAADIIVVEHVQLRSFIRRLHPSVVVVDMHNVESVLAGRMAEAEGRTLRGLAWRVERLALRRLERRALSATHVLVVSETDRRHLRALAQEADPIVVPNAWEDVRPQETILGRVVSFVGLMSWEPNVQAATWLCESVWPRVRAKVPSARLQLVGRDPSPAVHALAGPTIEISGTVPDLTEWYQRTSVATAPLLAGGGSRLKILEALAMGRPVVATSIGVEGLEDLIGRGVLIADEPDQFAALIVELLEDPARAARLGEQGSRAVSEDHSWAAATAPLILALRQAQNRS